MRNASAGGSTQAGLAYQLVVLGMRTDPEPQQVLSRFDGQRSVAQTNSDCTVLSDFLEMQRRVRRIGLQQFVILISKVAD